MTLFRILRNNSIPTDTGLIYNIYPEFNSLYYYIDFLIYMVLYEIMPIYIFFLCYISANLFKSCILFSFKRIVINSTEKKYIFFFQRFLFGENTISSFYLAPSCKCRYFRYGYLFYFHYIIMYVLLV